jgi:hypothetical protein
VLRSERDQIPIVTGPRGIVWVVGHLQDVHSIPREGTTERILISSERRPFFTPDRPTAMGGS